MRNEFREIIDDFNLYDDEYFGFVFGEDVVKEQLAQLILRIITGRDDIIVREAHIEHSIPNLRGRGIRMDVRAVDETGSVFDVEFQRNDAGAGPHRARFNASVIDANYQIKGDDTRSIRLPETYVIFITENDVMGGGLAIYHVERKITELDNKPFNDGSHIIYVNGAYTDTSTAQGKLIHDFRSKKAAEMLMPEFAARTRELKETEEGYVKMSSKLEQFIEKKVASLQKKLTAEKKKATMEREKANRAYDAGAMAALFGLVNDGLLALSVASERASMSEAAFLEKMAEHFGAPA